MNEINNQSNNENSEKRFRILVCIDGSDESYRGLRYAARLGRGVDADITLLYVRLVDQGMNSGGLQVKVARENMIDWGLELPGVRYLNKGRDILIELGEVASDWEPKHTHKDVKGDPAGDHMIEYGNEAGKLIRMRLKVASSIEGGILDQQEEGKHDLIILGASGKRRAMTKFLGLAPVALKVATHAPCSVLVARELEEGKGHLICTAGTERSLDLIKKDALLANRCQCPISLLSVATEESQRPRAEAAIAEARTTLAAMNIPVKESGVRLGDPVREIVEAGQHHSLIVMSSTKKEGMRRFFIGGISFNVLEHAKNSVLIIR